MARREFGSIRKLASGRWQARYFDQYGERHKAPTTFTTRAEAAAFLARTQTELESGGWQRPAEASTTLAEYATAWLEDRADLRPRTVELYRGLLANHLLPQLGTLKLSAITTQVVRHWCAERLRSGVGRSTVAKAYRLLKTILGTAVVDEVLVRNPCVLRAAGSERTPERVPPTVEQALALADAIEPRWRMLVLMAAFSGLRWGELVALKRKNIDVEHGRVTVTHQLVETQHGTQLGPPKSDAGRRSVHLPPHLLPELAEHLATWVGISEDAWVFCGPLGAPPARRNFTLVWQRARQDAGLPTVRFHDLRHLSATLAATTGATTRELMSRMGHSSPRAALLYQHAAADRDAEIAAAMSRLVAPRPRRTRSPSEDQLALDLPES